MLPLTPAFNWKEYRQLSNKDLKQVLAQRGLTKSGTKATMVSRIIAYDEQHPFRFTDLPPEVRNMIYCLAATFSSPSSYWGKRDYSNLFQISQPIRNESIAFFYQQRTFTVFLQDTKRWALILAWLDKTSPVTTCKNTRNFIIRGDLSTDDIADMELFHSKLSDEARVVYCFWRTCREVEPVEEIRDAYAGMELGRVPVITYRVTGARLTFPPRMGWFGGKDGAAGAEAP